MPLSASVGKDSRLKDCEKNQAFDLLKTIRHQAGTELPPAILSSPPSGGSSPNRRFSSFLKNALAAGEMLSLGSRNSMTP